MKLNRKIQKRSLTVQFYENTSDVLNPAHHTAPQQKFYGDDVCYRSKIGKRLEIAFSIAHHLLRLPLIKRFNLSSICLILNWDRDSAQKPKFLP